MAMIQQCTFGFFPQLNVTALTLATAGNTTVQTVTSCSVQWQEINTLTT